MDSEKFDELINRYINGQCTDQEANLLESWYNSASYPNQSKLSEDQYALSKARIWSGLPEAAISSQQTSVKILGRRLYPYAAAVAILLIGLVTVFYSVTRQTPVNQGEEILAKDVSPGGNQATLTLPNGESIALASDQKGIIVHEGEVSYHNGMTVTIEGIEEATPLQLSTPRGGTYQIILSDGTKVWLNAASVLKYPSRFNRDSRVVELIGEAYFEVAHHVASEATGSLKKGERVPFTVITPQQTVQVLGTQFNISAYDSDHQTRTTLIKGSVRVASTDNKTRPVLLHVGSQAISNGSDIKVKTVNVESVIAWKDGVISFEQKNFAQIMQELSRWYNIDVYYEGGIPQNVYFGSAYRTDNLSVVLDMLQSSGIQYHLTKQHDKYQLKILKQK